MATPLAASSAVNTSNTDTHLSGRLSATTGCFTQDGNPSLVYFDCLNLIRNQLGFPHDPALPMTFGRHHHAMILIPYAKVSRTGNCAVVIGIRDDMLKVEIETFENVKKAALDVAVDCVIKEPHKGGWKWVGRDGNLFVSVRSNEVDRERAVLRKGQGAEEEEGGEDGDGLAVYDS
ncbi:MAG: hypothetical protein LQ346_006012 [Caloplaca aetnensis]|nr:MAG: hypothetical protein LQ346_006012 [Caloplaca aetnensis]